MNDPELKSRIVFSQSPDTQYDITYESSIFDPAVPVDIALNPMYTAVDEGFIFLSEDEYEVDAIVAYMSPSKLIADGEDFAMITLESVDIFGNPKPNQTINLSTDFGTLSESTVVTDQDGHASVVLTAEANNYSPSGTVTVDGPKTVDGTIPFEISQPGEIMPTIVAVPNSYQIQADGISKNSITGKLTKSDMTSRAEAVAWRKARSLFELFTKEVDGIVYSDNDGNFVIPNLTSDTDPGIWFVAVETELEGELIGDVVYWTEYPEISRGVENIEGLPALSRGQTNEYATGNYETVEYEEDSSSSQNSVSLNWLPPIWYGIRAEDQYQMNTGLNVTDRSSERISRAGSILRSATGAWTARHRSPLTGDLLDLTGNGRNMVFGERAARIEAGALVLPGSTGNYASVPDEAALDITGDLDLISRAKLTEKTGSSTLIGKYNTAGNQRSYWLLVNPTTGGVSAYLSDDGASLELVSSTANIPSGVKNDLIWYRLTFEAGTGDVTFYYSSENTDDVSSVTWQQLGDVVTSTKTSLFASTSILGIGRRSDASTPATGSIHRTIIKDGIDGTTVFDADFSQPTGIESFTCNTGQTVTINQSRSDASDPKVLGYDGTRYLYTDAVNGNRALSTIGASSFDGSVVLTLDMAAEDWSLSDRYFDGLSGNSGWQVGSIGSDRLRVTIGDGTTTEFLDSSALPVVDGQRHEIVVTIDPSSSTVTFDVDGVEAESVVGSFTSVGYHDSVAIAGAPGGALVFFGKTFRMAVADDSGSLLDIDFTDATQFPDGMDSTSGTASTGQTVTLNGRALLVDKPALYLDGVDDFLSVEGAPFELDGNTDLSVVIAVRVVDPAAGHGILIGNRLTLDAFDPGWRLASRLTPTVQARIADGTNFGVDNTDETTPDGQVFLVGYTIDATAEEHEVWVDGATNGAQSITGVGDLTSGNDLVIGVTANLAGSVLGGELLGAAVFVGQVLTAEQIAQAGKELGA